MKKTLVLVLVLALVLTMGIIAFAESVSGDEEIIAEETAEAAEETAEEPAEEPVEEPAEEPAEEPVEEPAEESAENPAEESAENPVEESDEMTSEERELEEWIAGLPSSWNATKEEFTFAFILSRMYQYCEEDGAVFVFQNNGTQTITLTLAEQYWRHADLTPEEGQALVEAMMKNPNISAPYVMLTSEIVTVEIPVGETVRLSLDADLLATSVYGVYGNVSATYGSLSASIE